MSEDPVFQRDGKWYFYEETWAYSQSPYDSEEEANEQCILYAKWLDLGPEAEFNHKPVAWRDDD